MTKKVRDRVHSKEHSVERVRCTDRVLYNWLAYVVQVSRCWELDMKWRFSVAVDLELEGWLSQSRVALMTNKSLRRNQPFPPGGLRVDRSHSYFVVSLFSFRRVRFKLVKWKTILSAWTTSAEAWSTWRRFDTTY